MKKTLATLMFAVIMLGCAPESKAVDIKSTFDSGIDGWTSVDDPKSLSNPGGYLQVKDITSSWLYIYAPDKFKGDWSCFKSISADIYAEAGQTVTRKLKYEFFNGTKSAHHEFTVNDVIPGKWVTLPVDLTPDKWNYSGDWNTLISNVTDFRIMMDLYSGYDTHGVDNVILKSACPDPAPVPEPTSMLLGLMSLAGVAGFRRNK